MSFPDPGTNLDLPKRQKRTLDGNESPIYDMLMQPYKKPYKTDETQMLNLNQIDALNIPQMYDIIEVRDNTNSEGQIKADKQANIPYVVVHNTEDDTSI